MIGRDGNPQGFIKGRIDLYVGLGNQFDDNLHHHFVVQLLSGNLEKYFLLGHGGRVRILLIKKDTFFLNIERLPIDVCLRGF